MTRCCVCDYKNPIDNGQRYTNQHLTKNVVTTLPDVNTLESLLAYLDQSVKYNWPIFTDQIKQTFGPLRCMEKWWLEEKRGREHNVGTRKKHNRSPTILKPSSLMSKPRHKPPPSLHTKPTRSTPTKLNTKVDRTGSQSRYKAIMSPMTLNLEPSPEPPDYPTTKQTQKSPKTITLGCHYKGCTFTCLHKNKGVKRKRWAQ